MAAIELSPKLKKFTITPSTSKSLLVGKTLQVEAKLTPKKATGMIPTYTSSDKTVAVIDKTGIITTLKTGQATITVKVGGKKKTFTLKVN